MRVGKCRDGEDDGCRGALGELPDLFDQIAAIDDFLSEGGAQDQQDSVPVWRVHNRLASCHDRPRVEVKQRNDDGELENLDCRKNEGGDNSDYDALPRQRAEADGTEGQSLGVSEPQENNRPGSVARKNERLDKALPISFVARGHSYSGMV